MKTLVELLHDEMVRSGYFGANGRDDEALAGTVGVVQEWLKGEQTKSAFLDEVFDKLIAEAGRGPDA